MFSPDAMRLNRTLKVVFALLLALTLPLQGYAASASCGPASAHAAALHAAPNSHCGNGPGVHHHHDCGNGCCLAAIALSPARWIVPRSAAPGIAGWVIWPPPAVSLDRLDRPPRTLLA